MGIVKSRVLKIIQCRVRHVMEVTATLNAMHEKSAARFASDDNANSSLARQTFAFKNASLEDATWNATQGFALRFAEGVTAKWAVYHPVQNSVTRRVPGEAV